MSLKTYNGSCHCGKISFEVLLDLGETETYRCNCTFCLKNRFWGLWTKQDALKPVKGDPAKPHGQEPGRCPSCNVLTYAFLPGEEWHPEPRAVISVASLDLSPTELSFLKVVYYDGLNNKWEEQPEVISYL